MPEEIEKTYTTIELPDNEGGKVVYVVKPETESEPRHIVRAELQPPAVEGWKHGIAKLGLTMIIGTIVEQAIEIGYNAAVRKVRSRRGR